jgi:hypothetical protein
MQLHLDEIATKITPGAHAILLLDQAGWHGAKALCDCAARDKQVLSIDNLQTKHE